MQSNKINLLVTPTRLVVLTALFLVVTANATFFAKVTEIYPLGADYLQFLLSVGIVLVCVMALLMALASLVIPTRIVVSVFIVLAALVGFFTDQFGTVIDDVMIQNIVETNSAEARDLLTPGFFLQFLVLGIFPVIAVWKLPFAPAARLTELRYKLQLIAASAVLIVICLYSFSSIYTDFFRRHKPLRYYTNPTFALYSTGKYLARVNTALGDNAFASIAEDAEIAADDDSHELIIMVVGEAVRTDRFSLNNYHRDTNPKLARLNNIVSYSSITACGTSTAVSVPCMFALAGREDYDDARAANTENVLDVLSNVGVSVLWRDNNSSSKGVADRVSYADYRHPELNPVCDDIECRDMGLLSGLQDYVDSQTGDILIVLHQMGNHGPAYFKRYPPEFERFRPACKSEDLSLCTLEEIGNAYDNAILYTDHFLAATIDFLQKNTPRFETAMIYIGDHGESLGEDGLYLHGVPYILAPDEQIDVPLIIWAGESSDIDINSAIAAKDKINSHDAISGALLSLFEVESSLTEQYDKLFTLREE